jgi:hypothetical protein
MVLDGDGFHWAMGYEPSAGTSCRELLIEVPTTQIELSNSFWPVENKRLTI